METVARIMGVRTAQKYTTPHRNGHAARYCSFGRGGFGKTEDADSYGVLSGSAPSCDSGSESSEAATTSSDGE